MKRLWLIITTPVGDTSPAVNALAMLFGVSLGGPIITTGMVL